MALVSKNRIKETSATTGTGAYAPAGAVDGYQSFAAIGDTNTCYYCAFNATDWEVGLGTYSTSGPTLARTAILASSNSGAAVNWPSGGVTLINTMPAEKAVMLDAAIVSNLTEIGAGLSIPEELTPAAGDFVLLIDAGGVYRRVDWSNLSGGIGAITFAQGDIIYYNGTALVKLSPGSSGEFLKTQGAGANPVWAALAGGGDMLAANNLSDVADAGTARTNLAAASSTFVDCFTGLIATVADQDYRIVINCPFACTINSITTRSTTGTCTLTGKINTTALGGTANSVSTSEQTQTHASDNDMAAGDDLVLTVSSNSSCENISVTVKITRTI